MQKKGWDQTSCLTNFIVTLKKKHDTLNENEILVIDMRGIDEKFPLNLILVLFQFFAEMNYVSTAQKSCVVIWSVPLALRGSIDEARRIAQNVYTHLFSFKSASLLIWEDESSTIFSNWEPVTSLIQSFQEYGELSFDSVKDLLKSGNDSQRLLHFFRSNAHLFDAYENKYRLRPWRHAITTYMWKRELKWFQEKTSSLQENGGIKLYKPGTQYRLPSTGKTVDSFYHFASLFSKREARIKVGWLILKVIEQLTFGTPKITIVVVTRPVIPIVKEVYRKIKNKEVTLLSASTIEELQEAQEKNKQVSQKKFSQAAEEAGRMVASEKSKEKSFEKYIHITTAIDTGWLCREVANVIGNNSEWLGTINLLDRRDNGVGGNDEFIELGTGEKLYAQKKTETGRVFSLGIAKENEKHTQFSKHRKTIAIDSVNLCPVIPAKNPLGAIEVFWDFQNKNSSMFLLGHVSSAEYHHYIYYVFVRALLSATNQNTKVPFLQVLINKIKKDLQDGKEGSNPQKTIIVHPPGRSFFR